MNDEFDMKDEETEDEDEETEEDLLKESGMHIEGDDDLPVEDDTL